MARHNRYSRLVGGLKVVLPIAALGLLSTLFLLSDPPDPDRALPYAEVDVAQLARELRLTQPRLAGVLPTGARSRWWPRPPRRISRRRT
jgi:lipopolysaccharide export system protein LptC